MKNKILLFAFAILFLIGLASATAPTLSNYGFASNGSEYQSPFFFHKFNVTVTNTNGTVGINFGGNNFTMSNLGGNVYNKSFAFVDAGSYPFFYWAYGTAGEFNKSSTFTYVIPRENLTFNISATPSNKVINGTETTVTALDINSKLCFECFMFLDGSPVGNPDTKTLPVGNHNYTFMVTNTTNYLPASATLNLQVTQNPNITGCTTITDSGNYQLMNNITFADEVCINVLADNVTIDGNGHYLIDNFTSFTYNDYGLLIGDINYVLNGKTNVTIKNINFYSNTGFAGDGLAIFSPDGSGNIIFDNITSIGFYNPLDLEGVTNLTVNNAYIQSLNIAPAPQPQIIYIIDGNNIVFNNLTIFSSNLMDNPPYWINSVTSFTGSDSYTMFNTKFQTEDGSITLDFINATVPNQEFRHLLKSNLNISNNFASLEISDSNTLNVSSSGKINFKGLVFNNPKVQINGVDCPNNICSNFQYSNGIANFDVSAWNGNLSLTEIPSTNITDCQDINSGGFYTIQNDINVPNGQVCFSVNVDDVEIFGDGHTISFNGNSGEAFQVFGRNNFSLNNLKIISPNSNNNYGLDLDSSSVKINNIHLTYSVNSIVATNMLNSTYTDITFDEPDSAVTNLGGQQDIYIFGVDSNSNQTLFNLVLNSSLGSPLEWFSNDIPEDVNHFINAKLSTPSGEITYPVLDTPNILINNVNISDNSIIIDESNSNFNVSSQISINGLGFTNPQIIRDGVVCPNDTCTNVQYSSGILTFDTTSSGNYFAEETPVTPTQNPNPNLIHGQGDIFNVVNSMGSGFGIFLSLMGIALPILLIGLGVVGVITAIGFGIAHIMKVAMNR